MFFYTLIYEQDLVLNSTYFALTARPIPISMSFVTTTIPEYFQVFSCEVDLSAVLAYSPGVTSVAIPMPEKRVILSVPYLLPRVNDPPSTTLNLYGRDSCVQLVRTKHSC